MSILSAGTSNTTSLIYTGDTTGAMVFQTNGTTEAMRIDASQRVLIGTTSASGNPANTEIAGLSPSTSDSYNSQLQIRTTTQNASDNVRVSFFHGGHGSAFIQSGYESAGYTNLAFATRGGGNPTERMRINSNGQITMPYQPAIFIALGTQQAVQTGDYYKIQLDDAVLNRGSHWNTSTKRFTAPVSGVYYINLSAYIYGSGSADVNVYVYVNGANTIRGFSYNPTNQSDANPGGAQLNATYYLNAGDYLEPYYGAGSTSMSIWNGGPYATHLCVYLLG
jgi:hypothetical protein